MQHLTHPNGFWRDTAQRLIVLRQDKSVVPALRNLVVGSGPTPLVARFHALWSLEGLGALDAALVRQQLKDGSPRMRVQALRASETLYKAGDKTLASDYREAANDADADVAIQAMLTLNVLKVADTKDVVTTTMASNKVRGVQEVGKWIVTPPANAFADPRSDGRAGGLTPEQRDQLQRGQAIYTEICYACHGDDGRGAPLKGGAPGATMAPPLAGSPRVQGHRDYVIKALLHGVTGPIGDRTFTEVMVPMGAQANDWVASIGSYVRNAFGNNASFISAADVARVRTMTTARKTSWTVPELEGTLPTLLPAQTTWVLSASHNSAAAARAVTLAGWSSGTPQVAGMWFQVELPEPVVITEVQFDAAATGRGGGGGGRGGAGAAAAGRGAGAGAPAAAEAGTAGAPGTPANPAVAPAAADAAGQVPGAGAGRGVVAAPPPPPVFPREYQIQVSMDGKTWSAPVAKGPGAPLILASFAPVRAKLIRITQTAVAAADAPMWSIQNLRLYQGRLATAR